MAPVPPITVARQVAVRNASGQDIPGFAAVRIVGRDDDDVMLVDVPSGPGQTAGIAFNGDAVIPNGGDGYATVELPTAALLDPQDPPPQVGDTWGTEAGNWKLRRNAPGFWVLGLGRTADEGYYAQVVAGPCSPVVIQITGTRDADGYQPGKVVFVRPATSTTSTTTTGTTTTSSTTTTTGTTLCPPTTSTTTTQDPAWQDGPAVRVWEVNRDRLGVGCRFPGLLCHPPPGGTTGTTSTTTTSDPTSTTTTSTTAAPALPVVLVQSNDKATDCTTTTTPDANDCYGQCRWDWNNGTKKWDKTTDGCCYGCQCDAPDFCPPAGTTCAVWFGSCSRNPAPSAPCNCVTTTTTTGGPTTTTTSGPTTTTTPGPGSCAGCVFAYVPGLGWSVLSVKCGNPGQCTPQCNFPVGAGSQCATTVMPCGPTTPAPPPPPPCNGDCLFVSDGNRWILTANNCRNGCAAGTCMCPAPSGPPGPCATRTSTACRCPASSSTTTTTDPTSTTTTTTTAAPYCTTTTVNPTCAGGCYWIWSAGGSSWTNLFRTCNPACGCYPPELPGTADCQIVLTACGPPTTTSTTTTTTTTSTSTTTSTTLVPTTTTTSTTTTPNPCFCRGQVTAKQSFGGGLWQYTINNVSCCPPPAFCIESGPCADPCTAGSCPATITFLSTCNVSIGQWTFANNCS